MGPDPDAALMVAFQAGDERAFRTLFAKHGRAMVSFCNHFVHDAARAEELAQDVFLKVHAASRRYRPTARFKTFLYRIASNHCLNELRRGEHVERRAAQQADALRGEARSPLGADDLPSRGATPEEDAAGRALAAAVEELLARLPEKQRAAFVLARFEGLSYDEVAEVLDTTVAAVKSLVHRATVAAAAALAPYTTAGPEEVGP
jgi:RNA polymerase sigma-70 factor, ECF subfamily